MNIKTVCSTIYEQSSYHVVIIADRLLIFLQPIFRSSTYNDVNENLRLFVSSLTTMLFNKLPVTLPWITPNKKETAIEIMLLSLTVCVLPLRGSYNQETVSH